MGGAAELPSLRSQARTRTEVRRVMRNFSQSVDIGDGLSPSPAYLLRARAEEGITPLLEGAEAMRKRLESSLESVRAHVRARREECTRVVEARERDPETSYLVQKLGPAGARAA